MEVAAIVFAHIHVSAQCGCATPFDVTHDPQMLNGKRMILPILLAVNTKDVGNFQREAMVVGGLGFKLHGPPLAPAGLEPSGRRGSGSWPFDPY